MYQQNRINLIIYSLLSTIVQSFYVRISDDFISVNQGDQFLISCSADTAYEFCKFVSPTDESCMFEWKRSEWNITKQNCHGLEVRVQFKGNYAEHQCGLLVSGAGTRDIGTWKCEVESYVFGNTRGYLRIGEFNVDVVSTTTTTTTSTPAPTTTTSSSSTTLEAMLSRGGRGLDIDYEAMEVIRNKGGLNNFFLKQGVFPAIMMLVMSILFLIVIFSIIMATKYNQKKKKSYSVDETKPNAAENENIEDDKTKTVPELVHATSVVEDADYLQEVFPHIIKFPVENNVNPVHDNDVQQPVAGPGLVGLGY